MKHMLKVDAFILFAIAVAYMALMFFSPLQDPLTIFPVCIVAIMVSMGFMEIDRRLSDIEASIEVEKSNEELESK